MKLRNKPDYASVEDKRGQGAKRPGFADRMMVELPQASITVRRPGGPPDNANKAMMKEAMASASAALTKMGNTPLPSRRAPKGNNPGSVASMKFPSRSITKK